MPSERTGGSILLFMVFGMAIFDTAGVASIAPFMAVLSNPDIVMDNLYLSWYYDFVGFERVKSKPVEIDSFIYFLGSSLFIIMLISTLFKSWTLYRFERYAQNCNISLSRRLVDGYLKQDYSWFLNRHSSELGKTILFEVDAVIKGTLYPLILIIAYGTLTIAIVILLFIVDYMLAILVSAGLGGIYFVTFFLLRNYISNIGEDRVAANRERFQIIQEGFQGIKDLKVYGLEHILSSRFYDPASRYAKHTATQHIIGKMPRFMMEILSFGGILLVILYLMKSYNGFEEIVPILSLYTLAAYRLMPSLQQVYSNSTTLRYSVPAFNTLWDDMKEINKIIKEKKNMISVEALSFKKGIFLKGINFQYDGQKSKTISNVTIKILKNSTVGFVGSTGSGKTTIIDIILGLLSPLSGEFLVDNKKINRDNIHSWQKSIGYVPQQIYLTDDTIKANIAFGHNSNDIDMDRLKNAATLANIHEFVDAKLPNKYETKIGEHGVRLSGGQRQRIGIARALYYDPEVLIFDEATSALDNITEKKVMNAISSFGRKKTIILIAHRLSTVRKCDNIFIFEDGKLSGEGSYNHLLSTNLQFQKMSNLNN